MIGGFRLVRRWCYTHGRCADSLVVTHVSETDHEVASTLAQLSSSSSALCFGTWPNSCCPWERLDYSTEISYPVGCYRSQVWSPKALVPINFWIREAVREL